MHSYLPNTGILNCRNLALLFTVYTNLFKNLHSYCLIYHRICFSYKAKKQSVQRGSICRNVCQCFFPWGSILPECQAKFYSFGG